MSINFIATPLHDHFMALCRSAKFSIKLCVPFVKTNVISEITNIKQNETSLQLITRINLQNFHSKASDLEALDIVLNAKGQVFNCSNLHAKFYLFDDKRLIVTSANLTSNGLLHNLEAGILCEDSELLNSAIKSYNSITGNQDVSRIGLENTAKIQLILDKLQPLPNIEYPDIELSAIFDGNLGAITDTLSGWKLSVFNRLNALPEMDFDIRIANRIASELGIMYPQNNNREAKVRQILQQLRDVGLIEFSGRGMYKKLWVK
ncbi:MAG: phospholipase D-like domain-containing protein [Victivallales bacterium]|jgi:HKD family nuclease|nr:phospholipase D-like domain-containing protein [Victivallales bacterium]